MAGKADIGEERRGGDVICRGAFISLFLSVSCFFYSIALILGESR